MRFPWQKKESNQFETVLQRLIAATYGSGTSITPDNCMKSPTVHAIVTAISRRFAVTPVHVFKTEIDIKTGIETRIRQPNHPIEKLLKKPNSWQSRVEYWLDLSSTLVRWGRYVAVKGQGTTGPIQQLWPINPGKMDIKQDSNFNVTFKFEGREQPYQMKQIHYIRGPARDFFKGDSPIHDCKEAVELEISAQDFGEDFFERGAVPLIVFSYLQGFKGFKTPQDEDKFVEDFQQAYSKHKRMNALVLPPGMEKPTPMPIENDKAQFLQTRQYQRTVIAGAFGIPPHFVGDLTAGTYANVEQQDKDFDTNVMMPYTTMAEAAMERDLLTQQELDDGMKIRFNLDVKLRANFADRQAGMLIQYQNGIITQDKWRNEEGMNPRPDGRGNRFFNSVQVVPDGTDSTNP